MIDISLAKGLSAYYAVALGELYERFEKSVGDDFKIFRTSNRKKWYESINKVVSLNGNYVLGSYVRQSKANPLWFFLHCQPNGLMLNDFDEKCFGLIFRECNAEGEGVQQERHLSQISHHALQRYIQRHPANWLIHGKLDISLFRRALVDISNWSIIYELLAVESREFKHCLLQPIIPTTDGLFLCKLDTKRSIILSVRTFVSNAQLRPEQLEMKRILLGVYDRYCELPFFTLLSSDSALRQTDLIFLRMFFADLICAMPDFEKILVSNREGIQENSRAILRGAIAQFLLPLPKEAANVIGPLIQKGQGLLAAYKKLHEHYKKSDPFSYMV